MNKMRLFSVALAILLAFTACTSNTNPKQEADVDSKIVITQENIDSYVVANMTETSEEELEGNLQFDKLNDADLLRYIEDDVYNRIVEELDSEKYFVQEVKATYISQEYIDELDYNSKSNVFFGYSLDELDQAFQGTRYVFSLGDNGETIVTEFEEYDDTYEKAVKNVAIGTGIIAVCVVIAVVTDGVGAPAAVSAIFYAAAKTGTIFALSDGVISGVTAGIVEGVSTGDVEAAFKASVLEGSESFKWSAITGVVTGAAGKTIKLYQGTKYGFTMNEVATIEKNSVGLTLEEAAKIQKESKYPIDVINEIHSMDEYKIFKKAKLKTKMVNGKNALIRKDIDINLVDDKGRTNLERMKKGLAAIDKNGNSYELHHIGQENDATLAILTKAEHDEAALHGFKTVSEIDRKTFNNVTKPNFWKSLAKLYETSAIK